MITPEPYNATTDGLKVARLGSPARNKKAEIPLVCHGICRKLSAYALLLQVERPQ